MGLALIAPAPGLTAVILFGTLTQRWAVDLAVMRMVLPRLKTAVQVVEVAEHLLVQQLVEMALRVKVMMAETDKEAARHTTVLAEAEKERLGQML